LHEEEGCQEDIENQTLGEQALELAGWRKGEDKTEHNVPLEVEGFIACCYGP
jgi:hypothetical protein